jgi:hypothetical protein
MTNTQIEAMHDCVAHYNGTAIAPKTRHPNLDDAVREIAQWHAECRATVDETNGDCRKSVLIARVNTLATVLGILEDVQEAER